MVLGTAASAWLAWSVLALCNCLHLAGTVTVEPKKAYYAAPAAVLTEEIISSPMACRQQLWSGNYIDDSTSCTNSPLLRQEEGIRDAQMTSLEALTLPLQAALESLRAAGCQVIAGPLSTGLSWAY